VRFIEAALAQGTGVRAEWILFALGGLMTLIVVCVFAFVLSRKDDEERD
jgi:hypothetical protein